ncbi:MAG: phosphoserine phosphatase SerB [Deltaproteobacteria bacterium]|nr:phosphoserine phosphatase SerB [Deltaproteobacteria bacterium]
MTTHTDRIVLHVSGADRPGVTSRLTEIIAEESATLVNIGQSAMHGYLMLSTIIDIPPDSHALRRILVAVSELGLRLEVSPLRDVAAASTEARGPAICVTVLGALGNGHAVAAITRFIASREMNILDIRTLSEDELNGLELIADLAPGRAYTEGQLAALRGEILALGAELEADIAVQRDDIFRRSKRLVCMDVDSTFVQAELIDELAALAGCKEPVAKITERAMRGELDFKQALAQRVALLKGLPMESAEKRASEVAMTPGAQNFARVLKSLGFRVGLVSGGFDFFVDELKTRFGLDFAFANELEVVDGRLTGRVQGSIVDAERKGQIVKDMAKVYKCRLEQTVAIGDGANDMLMLQTAGLGIAFRAKPKLQAVADMSLNYHERIDTLLFLMGFTARELRTLSLA